jgi:hypothetical protein
MNRQEAEKKNLEFINRLNYIQIVILSRFINKTGISELITAILP